MPKERLTCTRCSQRRQKCDRKQPCSRCVRNGEAALCTTQWKEGYNPSVHRRYPQKHLETARQMNRSSPSSSDPSPPSETHVLPSVQSHSSESLASNLPNGFGDFEIPEPRVLDISIGTLLNEKDGPGPTPGIYDQTLKYVQSNGKLQGEPSRVSSCFSPAAKQAELQYLQSILPDKIIILKIADYYQHYMLYWIGGLYHGPTFRQEILDACGVCPRIDIQNVDWRWLALLFSILSSAMIGCPESTSLVWGYTCDEKVKLAQTWGNAAVTCLVLGNYMSQYHIYSIQAIFVLHAYEHLVGSTNQWVGLRSVAIVIAKGLGLHRLGTYPDDQRVEQLTEDEKKRFVAREIGRRAWALITTQDWICSLVQNNNYTVSIQKIHFTTTRPMDLDENTMLPIDDSTPSVSVSTRYFHEYAGTLLDFHNTMQSISEDDDAMRYAALLRFDGEFRAVCAAKIPKCLSLQTPLDPQWPKWVKWARAFHQVSINHKIIMLHQSFLTKSFRNSRYTYSRWACATSAKNIINMAQARDADEPQWWVEQAFLITSAICLLLDMFHRRIVDAEALEYYTCVSKTIRWLQQFFTSSVALHGIRLLNSLLHEYRKLHPEAQAALDSTKIWIGGGTDTSGELRAWEPLSGQGNAASMAAEGPPVNDMNLTLNFDFDIDTIGFEDLMDIVPTTNAELDNTMFFGSILGLANT